MTEPSRYARVSTTWHGGAPGAEGVEFAPPNVYDLITGPDIQGA